MSSAEIVRASAGTGKTYALVESYIRILLRHKLKPSSVVAITFTRKAARELLNRIRVRLRSLEANDLLSDISRAPINNFHGLALQLLSFSGANVGVFKRLLVLGQEGEDRLLFQQACEEAWFANDTNVANAVKQLAAAFKLDSEFPVSLWSALSQAREDGCEIIGSKLVTSYDPDIISQRITEQLTNIRTRLLLARSELSDTVSAKVENFLKLVPTENNVDTISWIDNWTKAATHLDRRGKLGQLISSEEKDFISKQANNLINAEFACAALASNFTKLVDAAWQNYQRLKQEHVLFDFADIIERAVHLLENDASLHARVLQRFRAVLVDEAQDTNRLQRRFVHLLAGLSGPAAGSQPPATLFVVGDRKQAIYTFRGADIESFDSFTADIEKLGGSKNTLHTSYRTTTALCASINHLGQKLFGHEYEAIQAADTINDNKQTALWIETPAAENNTTNTLLEAEAVADYVAKRLQAGRLPSDFAILMAAMTKAVHYCDALLKRGIPATMGSGGLYAEREIIDIAALLRWCCDPDDRLAAAIALRSPLFGLSDDGLLYLFGPQAEDNFVKLSVNQAKASCLSDNDIAAITLVSFVMPRLWQGAKLLNADAFLHWCNELLQIEAILATLPGGEQKVANVKHLQSLAIEYAQNNAYNTWRFARELSIRIERGVREPLTSIHNSNNAVVIGTIHQAKGLEFPAVLLVDLAHGKPGDFNSLRYSREHGLIMRPRINGELLKCDKWHASVANAKSAAEAEQDRLLYVAVTRAKSELVFFAPESENLKTNKGLLRRLQPWHIEAVAAGVLQVIKVNNIESNESLISTLSETNNISPQIQSTIAIAEGSEFSLSVTELAVFLQCQRRGFLRTQLRFNEAVMMAMSKQKESDTVINNSMKSTLNSQQAKAITQGTIAHAVMARLDATKPSKDIQAWVYEGISAIGYDIDDPNIHEVFEDCVRFFNSPLGKKLIKLPTDKHRHELPFIANIAASPYKLSLRGQFDVVYEENNAIIILDFKHSKPSPAELELDYLQLEIYALAVSMACDISTTVRTQLVFLHTEEIIEHAVTAKMRDNLRKRIKNCIGELAIQTPMQHDLPCKSLNICKQLMCLFIKQCHPQISKPDN
ncbi:MAG: UvrD-helicase domain-containing protein [Deltaproteobacteria bacterium]|nr:UvrD-helicase domain-containing protein [Deltaproteobacteria bacterium]